MQTKSLGSREWNRVKTILKILYQPYKWLVVGPVTALATAVLGGVCILVSIVLGQDAADRPAVIWSRLCCFLVPVKVELTGTENYSPRNSYVIIANHRSLVDIIILHGWLRLKIKWIMKKELAKIPIFGTACRKLGCIYIDRKDREAAIHSIKQAQASFTPGSSVIFFPEGTRSRNDRVLPFKKGAFRFAMDTGLPILPVTIRGSDRILPPRSLDLFPGKAGVVIHPPIDMSRAGTEDIDRIIASARTTISGAL